MEELSWKEKKQQFVSDLTGTTLLEITTITSFFPFLVMLRTIILSSVHIRVVRSQVFRFLLDFIVLVFPVLLIVTELSSIMNRLLVSIAVMVISMLLFISAKTGVKEKENYISYVRCNPKVLSVDESWCDEEDLYENEVSSAESDLKGNGKKGPGSLSALKFISVVSTKLPVITTYRAWVSIASCICILAVDFHAFPRRLAKTELFGAGLMDVGVGFYVLSNALTCRDARVEQSNANVPLKQKHNQLHLSTLFFQLLSTWPIVLIGLIRLVSVKTLGYNENISEYGVHWNFFFTLACVKGLASIVLFFVHSRFSLTVSVFIAISYQFLLSSDFTNATAILTNSNREGILMQNKEGLASSIGFLSLYFAGVHLGSFLFKPRSNLDEWLRAAIKLLASSIVLWCMLYFCQVEIQQISRRLANMSYILWLLAQTTFLLSAFLCVDIVTTWYISKSHLPLHSAPNKWLVLEEDRASEKIKYSPPPTSMCLLCAINRNQLFYFLLSNLATGLVNGLVDTMSVDNFYSIVILCIYNVTITAVVWFLNAKEITLKFW